MAKTFILRVAVIGLAASLGTSNASLAQAVPAELPPASYSGDQYVDSRGCVFVRVGFGAATEWVPRVGRDRRAVCGFQPSGGGGQAAPDLASNDTVVIIGEDPVAPAPAAPAPVIAAAPAPAPVVRTPAPVAAPAAVTVIAPTVGVTGCPNLPANAQPYFTGDDVRCGPQARHPGDGTIIGPQSGLGIGGGEPITGTPRSFALSAPPPGYELAWEDGRLNPYRGIGTPAGEAQMLQVWTDTVPRRLASVPLSGHANAQISYAGTGGAGHGVSVVASSSRPALGDGGDVRAPRARVPAAEAPSNEVRVGAGHRHVLAGTFGGQAEAAAAYQRLSAAGLPARIGQVRRQGSTLFVVMAGPYGDPQSLGRALLQARGAGFPGAMTRN
ncbi:SPOR domain-containing protein [Hasllibacter sp. MH4015]|uniref:SPOR domain-containing protein n=1 Tax=Hasllibacter sp. MH4015 TaxID=2854029 RepID=UPI001CD4ED9F|nr:SPOR domain-containing protein [Hasllibacter sp. MH4015]